MPVTFGRWIRKEKMKMKPLRRIFALILACLFLILCGCSPKDGTEYDNAAAEEMRKEKYVYLTLWSWQITQVSQAEQYAQKAVECGFTAVDFSVLWANFEPLKGHFDWTYLDGVVDAFTQKGLKVSLQPLLWTKDLSWADELAVQHTSQKGAFEEEGRGSFLSFTDADTLKTVENTLQSFASHAASRYGAHLTRWGVRLSCFGEFDYSVNEDLDYSPSSARAFYDYLKEEYGTWQALSQARNLGISSREDLEKTDLSRLVDACRGEWRRYRQKALFSMLDMACAIFRSADENVPIVFSLGTYTNGMNAVYSGVVDLWTALNETDFDILAVSCSDGVDPSLMLSFVTSLTRKPLSVEVDGAWALEEGRDVKSQVEICGKYGVFSLSTANFTLEQLDAHKETLSSYSTLLSSATLIGEADGTSAILVLTNAIAADGSPLSYGAVFGEVWDTLSQQGARRVRFITEAQLGAGETSLEGVTTLHTGTLKGTVPVSKKFVTKLLSSAAVLSGNPLQFVHLDGSELPSESAAAMALRLPD